MVSREPNDPVSVLRPRAGVPQRGRLDDASKPSRKLRARFPAYVPQYLMAAQVLQELGETATRAVVRTASRPPARRATGTAWASSSRSSESPAVTVEFQLRGRRAVTPRDAATVLVVREGARRPGGVLRQAQRRGALHGRRVRVPRRSARPGRRRPGRARRPRRDECAARLGEPTPAQGGALHVAALRECLEESGILLATGEVAPTSSTRCARPRPPGSARPIGRCSRQHGVTLALAALVPFARWVTPRQPRRGASTRASSSPAPPADVASRARHDGGETVDSAWLTPTRPSRARGGRRSSWRRRRGGRSRRSLTRPMSPRCSRRRAMRRCRIAPFESSCRGRRPSRCCCPMIPSTTMGWLRERTCGSSYSLRLLRRSMGDCGLT
jgi:hypothetical protein